MVGVQEVDGQEIGTAQTAAPSISPPGSTASSASAGVAAVLVVVLAGSQEIGTVLTAAPWFLLRDQRAFSASGQQMGRAPLP